MNRAISSPLVAFTSGSREEKIIRAGGRVRSSWIALMILLIRRLLRVSRPGRAGMGGVLSLGGLGPAEPEGLDQRL
jgi:hypothetical protein